MRIPFVLLLTLAGSVPAMADTLIWQSKHPTAYVDVHDRFGSQRYYCYATKYRNAEGSVSYRNINCPGDVSAYSDIGMPADGSWPVNMGKVVEARHAKVLANGFIKLY